MIVSGAVISPSSQAVELGRASAATTQPSHPFRLRLRLDRPTPSRTLPLVAVAASLTPAAPTVAAAAVAAVAYYAVVAAAAISAVAAAAALSGVETSRLARRRGLEVILLDFVRRIVPPPTWRSSALCLTRLSGRSPAVTDGQGLVLELGAGVGVGARVRVGVEAIPTRPGVPANLSVAYRRSELKGGRGDGASK